MLLLPRLIAGFLQTVGSDPHFSVVASFRYGVWSEEVRFSRMVSPLAPACWLEVPDRSRSSSFAAVQDIWAVYMETLLYVPVEVRNELRRFDLMQPDVDAAWKVWSSAAEAGLLTAYKIACGPRPQKDSPFLGRGKVDIRVRRIGGRAPGRFYSPARADDVDVATCESFINSSLNPVILFRRRLRSVGDVLKRYFRYGFTSENIPGFNSMDIESQEDIKRCLRNGHTEQRRLANKCKQGGGK